MHKNVHSVLHSKITINKISIRYIDILFFLAITCVTLILRLVLLPYRSGDYNTFLVHWFSTLKENGGLSAIGLSMGDYTPPYIYILSLLTYLPIDSLFSIKLVSILFDFIAAFFIMKIIYEKYQNTITAIISYSLFLLLPTVILNSAMWAQCDIIFTTFLVLSVYYATKDKPALTFLFFSIAFCFKLQAVFLAPFLIYLWINNKCKLRHFFIIPLTYIVSIIPAFLAGRPLLELLTIYISQAGQYKRLSLNAPNLMMWFNSIDSSFLSTFAILLAFSVVLLTLYYLYKKQVDPLLVATFFSLIIPFLLPYMHERYFYTADILTFIYAFYNPKRFYIAILVSAASLASYCPFLLGFESVNISLMALFMASAIIILVYDMVNHPVKIK